MKDEYKIIRSTSKTMTVQSKSILKENVAKFNCNGYWCSLLSTDDSWKSVHILMKCKKRQNKQNK